MAIRRLLSIAEALAYGRVAGEDDAEGDAGDKLARLKLDVAAEAPPFALSGAIVSFFLFLLVVACTVWICPPGFVDVATALKGRTASRYRVPFGSLKELQTTRTLTRADRHLFAILPG